MSQVVEALQTAASTCSISSDGRADTLKVVYIVSLNNYPHQMPEPPQLAPLNVEEQQLYSESLPDNRAPHPVSKAEP